MVKVVGDSCLECPFFELRNNRNSASGGCNAPDLDRFLDNPKLKDKKKHELAITGKYSGSNIIKVPRPDWCPLNIGDAIITLRKKRYDGWDESLSYDLKKKVVIETYEPFEHIARRIVIKKWKK